MTGEVSRKTVEAVEDLDIRLNSNICKRIFKLLDEPATFAGACYDYLQGEEFSVLGFVRALRERGLKGCAKLVLQDSIINKPAAVARYLA
jgi:hypothetical protein